jgi:hypothetical protein
VVPVARQNVSKKASYVMGNRTVLMERMKKLLVPKVSVLLWGVTTRVGVLWKVAYASVQMARRWLMIQEVALIGTSVKSGDFVIKSVKIMTAVLSVLVMKDMTLTRTMSAKQS